MTDTQRVMKTLDDALREFEEKKPPQGWETLAAGEETELRPFGYKYRERNTIHEVTDWGNLRKFIVSVWSAAEAAGRTKGIEDALIQVCSPVPEKNTLTVTGMLRDQALKDIGWNEAVGVVRQNIEDILILEKKL